MPDDPNLGDGTPAAPTSPAEDDRAASTNPAEDDRAAPANPADDDRAAPTNPAEDDWAAQRARAVAHHGAELTRRRQAEAEQARAMIAGFIAAAAQTGPPAVALRARSYGGRSYRTSLRGWYLTPSRTVAVSTTGEYYSLLVPASATAWLTGVTPDPQPPRLIIGEGARDGESVPLATLLDRLLHP